MCSVLRKPGGTDLAESEIPGKISLERSAEVKSGAPAGQARAGIIPLDEASCHVS